MQKSSN